MSDRTKDRWHHVWEWEFPEWFNAKYDATASAEGLLIYCEIQGPFCGYDQVSNQTWDEFLAKGPVVGAHMPESTAADIRAFVLARRQR